MTSVVRLRHRYGEGLRRVHKFKKAELYLRNRELYILRYVKKGWKPRIIYIYINIIIIIISVILHTFSFGSWVHAILQFGWLKFIYSSLHKKVFCWPKITTPCILFKKWVNRELCRRGVGLRVNPNMNPLPTETWTLLTISRNWATGGKTGDKNWRSKKIRVNYNYTYCLLYIYYGKKVYLIRPKVIRNWLPGVKLVCVVMLRQKF